MPRLNGGGGLLFSIDYKHLKQRKDSGGKKEIRDKSNGTDKVGQRSKNEKGHTHREKRVRVDNKLQLIE